MTDVSRRTALAAGVAGAATVVAACTGDEGESMNDMSGTGDLPARHVMFQAWEGAEGLDLGTGDNTTITSGAITLADSGDSVEFTDPHDDVSREYDVGTWVSPWADLPFGATQIIPSWMPTTPAGTWIEIALQGRTPDDETTEWFNLGRWASGDGADDIYRATESGQSDQYASVNVDILAASDAAEFTSFRVRLTLHRLVGSAESPAVSMVGAVATALPPDDEVETSEPGEAVGTVLDVPTYSQMRHVGHYPQWNGGGQAWCSPTCLAMVLDYFDLGPTAADTEWVDIDGEDTPQVDHLARMVFDYDYGGAGNWTYNTAYAAEQGARAYVTRLRSLAEAEAFIAAGIPLICSASFTEDELQGAGFGTNGHLLTLVGFDDDGDVVMNDPASALEADDGQVRRTYRRDQFENVWIGHSGGLVYVITPPGHEVPEVPDSGEPNWA